MPGDGAAPGAPKPPPPGLRQQATATVDSLKGLARAHVDLAKAEASDIASEIKVVAAAVAVAVGALLLIAFLVPIGILLFTGEWLFGSLGWGVLHGTEALVLVAVAGLLAALGAGRVGRSIVIALVVGVVVSILFGTETPNRIYRLVGDQFGAGSDPGPIAYGAGAGIGAVIGAVLGVIATARGGSAKAALGGMVALGVLGAILGAFAGGLVRLAENDASRPMVVGFLAVGIVLGLAGLVLGGRTAGFNGALTGLIVGVLVGGGIGAFSAITFTWHIAVAIGLALFLGFAPILMGLAVVGQGINGEALKARFYPHATIDTAKETLEWAKARIPGAPKS